MNINNFKLHNDLSKKQKEEIINVINNMPKQIDDLKVFFCSGDVVRAKDLSSEINRELFKVYMATE